MVENSASNYAKYNVSKFQITSVSAILRKYTRLKVFFILARYYETLIML